MATSLDFINYVCDQINGIGEVTPVPKPRKK